MLHIAKAYISKVRTAQAPEDLYGVVRDAIRLEHATIPAYLASYFSLKPGANDEVAEIIRSIVIEEMLHMSIASNLLIALGGAPEIDEPGFVPTYPGKLPMDAGQGVIVGLGPCSIGQVKNTFMQIEAPEHPREFPHLLELKAAPPPPTIGQFYAELLKTLKRLGPAVFKGDFALEVTGSQWFKGQLFPIVDYDSASRAVDIIVVQGEGTTTSPEDDTGGLAHYYRFRQIVEGRMLVKGPKGWSYSGAAIAIDPAGVFPMEENAKSANYPVASRARNVVDRFNAAYSDLLRALHRTFNGEPGQIDVAMGLMYDVRFAAQDVAATPRPAGDGVCGLPFEYVPA
jgi:hypothetical protein